MIHHNMLLFTIATILLLSTTRSDAWTTKNKARGAVGLRSHAPSSSSSSSSKGGSFPDPPPPPPARGDALREATGIRPSLHPVTINALRKLIVARAKRLAGTPFEEENDDENAARPVDLALYAGRIAADAVASRQTASAGDGMALTLSEQQTVAGRVVGVTVRLSNLESELRARCSKAPWISKYRAWDTFGILGDDDVELSDGQAVRDRIMGDPLFALSRAECLLAVYLSKVEEPELVAKNVTVPGGSVVDFLDEDRRSALLDDR